MQYFEIGRKNIINNTYLYPTQRSKKKPGSYLLSHSG